MTQSMYIIPCLCGATVQSHLRLTQCDRCRRILFVEPLSAACGIAAAEREPMPEDIDLFGAPEQGEQPWLQ